MRWGRHAVCLMLCVATCQLSFMARARNRLCARCQWLPELESLREVSMRWLLLLLCFVLSGVLLLSIGLQDLCVIILMMCFVPSHLPGILAR